MQNIYYSFVIPKIFQVVIFEANDNSLQPIYTPLPPDIKLKTF